jgi:hypothetical protein
MARTNRTVWSTASTSKELLTHDLGELNAKVRAFELTAAEMGELEQACGECRALMLSSAPPQAKGGAQ